MLLARTGGQALLSPGFFVLAGVALICVSLFLRLIVLPLITDDAHRAQWWLSHRGGIRFQLWLGILMVVGGLIAFAATGHFFIG